MSVRSVMAKALLTSLALVSLFSGEARASGATGNTVIVEVAIQRQFGDFVLIRTAGPLVGSPSCYTNAYWHFTLSIGNPGDRELYAMILSAFSAGSTVTMSGKGTCNEFGSIESLQSINLIK